MLLEVTTEVFIMTVSAQTFDESKDKKDPGRTLSWNIPMAGGAKGVSEKSALSLAGFSETNPLEFENKSKKVTRFSSSVITAEEAHKEKVFGNGIIGASPAMRSIYEIIQKVGRTRSSVLITGESGVGKELVARAVHNSNGSGGAGPFVAINCGALPAGLMESELFGHEKGAFTGASAKKIGKAELADGGTLFLDEIATMPLFLQVKLLRFLQDRTFTRVGGNKEIKVNIRLIAAANTSLRHAIEKGEFREDLFYRLNVIPVEVPPLRERGADILLLAEFFLHKYADKYSRKMSGLSAGALKTLRYYGWPGNVRELENIMERLVVLAADEGLTSEADLPQEIRSEQGGEEKEKEVYSGDFKAAVRSFEHSYILSLLEKTGWNRVETARLMNVHRNTLLMKMKSLNIAMEIKKQSMCKSPPYRAGHRAV